MKIYTKKGDAGGTELLGGVKVSKADQRIRTYGVFDELNAVLGLTLAETAMPDPLSVQLIRIQSDLFRAGTELATPEGKKLLAKAVTEAETQALEQEIDAMEAELPPLKNFILPGGVRTAGLLHLARTICRRAERELAALNADTAVRPELLQYINRLSDYLFVAARWVNHRQGGKEEIWKS